jgi:hypothetical protein
MIASALVFNRRRAACNKHLSRLSRRRAAVWARRPAALETILCPHAVPFRVLTHGSGEPGQLSAGSGGAEQSSWILRGPDVKAERERVSNPSDTLPGLLTMEPECARAARSPALLAVDTEGPYGCLSYWA